MITDKEIPNEYISIRQLWLRAIDDCRRAISQRAIQEATDERVFFDIGDRTVVYTIDAFYRSLCDYGEATVRSDVDKYVKDVFSIEVNKIWKKDIDNNKKWQEHCKKSITLYDVIIKILNKYNMLFERPPSGFSNVEMEATE